MRVPRHDRGGLDGSTVGRHPGPGRCEYSARRFRVARAIGPGLGSRGQQTAHPAQVTGESESTDCTQAIDTVDLVDHVDNSRRDELLPAVVCEHQVADLGSL